MAWRKEVASVKLAEGQEDGTLDLEILCTDGTRVIDRDYGFSSFPDSISIEGHADTTGKNRELVHLVKTASGSHLLTMSSRAYDKFEKDNSWTRKEK